MKKESEESLKKLDPTSALKGLAEEAVAAAVGDVGMGNAAGANADHASESIKALLVREKKILGSAPGLGNLKIT